jgi:hypothetical protein
VRSGPTTLHASNSANPVLYPAPISTSLSSSFPLSASPSSTPPSTPRKNAKDKRNISDEIQSLIANAEDGDYTRLELGPLGSAQGRVELTGPAHAPPQWIAQESVQKMTRDVVTKIEAIKAKAEQTDIFDEAFSLVLKLKIIIQVYLSLYLLFYFNIFLGR